MGGGPATNPGMIRRLPLQGASTDRRRTTSAAAATSEPPPAQGDLWIRQHILAHRRPGFVQLSQVHVAGKDALPHLQAVDLAQEGQGKPDLVHDPNSVPVVRDRSWPNTSPVKSSTGLTKLTVISLSLRWDDKLL